MAEERRRSCGDNLQELYIIHDRRIGVVEQEIIVLQKDVIDNRAATNCMVAVLNEIKLEIVGAKASIKLALASGSIIVFLLSGLYGIHWLNIPQNQSPQNESHK